MYHISFIHSPVDEHDGYFQVLAVVNNVAVNIREGKVWRRGSLQWSCDMVSISW